MNMRFYLTGAALILTVSISLAAGKNTKAKSEARGACVECDELHHEITMGKIAAAEMMSIESMHENMTAQILKMMKIQEKIALNDPTLDEERPGRSLASGIGQLIEVASQIQKEAKLKNTFQAVADAEKEVTELFNEVSRLTKENRK